MTPGRKTRRAIPLVSVAYLLRCTQLYLCRPNFVQVDVDLIWRRSSVRPQFICAECWW